MVEKFAVIYLLIVYTYCAVVTMLKTGEYKKVWSWFSLVMAPGFYFGRLFMFVF